jgi:hypothetical protein
MRREKAIEPGNKAVLAKGRICKRKSRGGVSKSYHGNAA